jgi:predicted TIM-barrel fold metal-dependent hydrolase
MSANAIVFLLGIIMFLPAGAASTEKVEQLKAFEKNIRAVQKSGKLPIIDVEYHHGKVEVDVLLKKMEEYGVALTWLGPNEKLGSDESLRLNSLHPGSIVPTTVHGDGKKWHGSDKGFLDELARDARSGKYFAMGEFEARHYPSDTNNRDVHMPVDSEAMQRVFQLSSETGLPFLMHHEAEDALLPEVERMLAKYPNAKLIWCHVGRNRNYATWKAFMKVDTIRDLLKKYPNLYFDFVQSPPGSNYRGTGYMQTIMYDMSLSGRMKNGGVSLTDEWKNLLEEFPDRFLIGSDINTGRFNNYGEVMNTLRMSVLQGLKNDTAEKIAFKNAWKMMSGNEWKD